MCMGAPLQQRVGVGQQGPCRPQYQETNSGHQLLAMSLASLTLFLPLLHGPQALEEVIWLSHLGMTFGSHLFSTLGPVLTLHSNHYSAQREKGKRSVCEQG